MSSSYAFDWSDLAFGNKKAVNNLRPTFIAAPREISTARFTQLVKEYLPIGNIVLGLAKEDYIAGLEGQPQFRTLKVASVQKVIDKVNASSSKYKIYTLTYFQREFNYLLQKLDFPKVLLINGSWHHAFHNLPAYYSLANRRIDYTLISPFVDEDEAKKYETHITKEIAEYLPDPDTKRVYTDEEMMGLAADAAKWSFDYNFQTGVVLGKKSGKGYKLIAQTFNRVVPFQTYAMLHGASRETHFSPPNDLNHYDAVHAEVEMIIKAQKERIDLTGTALFINLLPCPSCSRMFCETDITEFIYESDHSSGHAVKLLEQAGKTVRRLVR